MRIAETYSHLNGLEALKAKRGNLWQEIRQVITSVNGPACKTKISRERTMQGRMLYSPVDLNQAFKDGFRNLKWDEQGRKDFYCCRDPETTREALALETASEQKSFIEDNGFEAIPSYNSSDFSKNRVALEVQFGKYSFVTFDLFVKHAPDYMHNRIDVGVEIIPMKAMEREMSSGPPYYEKHLHEIIRQGRIYPPVPIVLIGVEP